MIHSADCKTKNLLVSNIKMQKEKTADNSFLPILIITKWCANLKLKILLFPRRNFFRILRCF